MKILKVKNIKYLSYINIKTLIRDKMTIFWFMVFPVIMSVLFGYVIPYLEGTPNLVVINEESSEQNNVLLKQLETLPNLELKKEQKIQQTIHLAKVGEIPFLIIIKQDNSLEIHFQTEMKKWSKLVKNVINNYDPSAQLKYFEYNQSKNATLSFIIPGMVALTIMQIGLFGGNNLLVDRSRDILRRLKTNGILSGDILVSHIITRLILVVLSSVILILVGTLFLNQQIILGNLFMLLLSIIIGGFVFLSIGLLIASVFRSPDAGNIFTQTLNFPMAFLSGVFWQVSILPSFLQTVSWILPLTPYVNMIRGLMFTGISVNEWLAYFGILSAWGISCFLLGSFLFKWE